MKIKYCLAVIFCFTFLLASCGKDELPQEIGEPSGPTAVMTSAVKDGDAVEAGVLPDVSDGNESLPTVDFTCEELAEYDAEEKHLLLSGQLILPKLTVDGGQVDKALNDRFEAEKKAYYAETERMKSESAELLANMETEYWNTFLYNMEYRLTMLDERYVSLVRRTDVYLGGAHSTPSEEGVVIDIKTGNILSLADIVKDMEKFASFAADEIRPLVNEDELLDPSYDALQDIIADGTFYFDREGMVFISNVYVLYPYSEGIKYFTIPYGKLTEYLILPIDGGADFSRFYSFHIDGEDGEDVLGYADRRESLCPYPPTDVFSVNMTEDIHTVYIVPRYKGSRVTLERIRYESSLLMAPNEVLYSCDSTAEDFCLRVSCPMYEDLSWYIVTVEHEGRKAEYELKYVPAGKTPVSLIK